MPRPPLRSAFALAVCLLLCAGCAALAPRWRDLRGALGGSPPQQTPLVEEPAADLPSPEGLRGTSGEFRAVPLKWDPLLAGEVGGYVVERAFDREGPFERLAVLPGRLATVYVDRKRAADDDGAEETPAGLGDGTTAFYRVRAWSPQGHLSGAFSEIAVATTAPLPDPPGGLRAYSHQPRSVPLSWRPSEDPHVVGYVIDRSPSYRGPFEPLASLDGRHQSVYVDEGLGDLRVFYYRVAARNAGAAVGEPSEPVRAVTKPEPLPPIGLRVAEQRLGANRLAWEPNVEPDLAGYRLVRLRAGGSSSVVTSLSGDTTTAEDAAVGADEHVSYTVIALDRDGLESDAAEPIVVESEGYELTATPRGSAVVLSWKPRRSEGYDAVRVLRTRRWRQRDLGRVRGSEFVDTDVVPGARYRYNVVFERADLTQAPPSKPVEVTVPER